MSGHSKWKNNLGRKTSQDAKKSVNFAKLSKAITVAVLEGGSGDPNFNPRLRVAVDAARAGSMPKENIERAIAKGSGPDKSALVSTLYEIFGPHGSQMLAVATTDNANRTNSEVRTIIERNGGKLGVSGSVRHLFTHCGVIELGKATGQMSDDELLNVSSSLEAIDYIAHDDGHVVIYFPFQQIGKAKHITDTMSLVVFDGPNTIYRPTLPLPHSEGQMNDVATLIDALEAHDDVHEVFTNIE